MSCAGLIGEWKGRELPADAQRMRAWTFTQVKFAASNDNPFEADELTAMFAERKREEHPLGEMPLVVLSRGVPEQRGPKGRDAEQEHERDQVSLVALSNKGRQVIARHSGHHIQLDEPYVVVTAIYDVVAAAHQLQ